MTNRPNIVFITIDAWRYDAFGPAPDKHWLDRYGLSSKLHTPNLDRFAAESVYFTQALASAPHTTVSHASIMTGLFPPQHGVRSFFYERLPMEVKTLAEVLGEAGYLTVTLREAEDPGEPGILQKVDVLRGFEATINDLRHLTTLGQQAMADGRPVFAFLHLWDIHAPYLYSNWAKQNGCLDALWLKVSSLAEKWGIDPPEPSLLSEKIMMDFQRRVAERIPDVVGRIEMLFDWYVEGVTWFDRHRWPVVENILKESGLWENAIIFVYGDHGEGVHPDGHGIKVFNHGQSLLDDVLRVPLLVHGLPDTTPKIIDEQVSLVDLVPTVLKLLGIDPSESLGDSGLHELGGHSLLPRVNGQAYDRPPPLHFAELCQGGPDFTLAQPSPQYLYQRCVRGNGYKLLCHDGPVLMQRYSSWQDRIHRLGRKLVRKLGQAQEPHFIEDRATCRQLYWTDLQADPDELEPHHWQQDVPAEAIDLRAAVETLYQSAIRGPAIDTSDFDESAVLQRLAALGYVE